MKSLEILYKIDTEHKYASLNTDSCVRSSYVYEAISELQEIQKEDEYIKQKMKEALSMGNRAQSLAFVEVYQIINNRTTK